MRILITNNSLGNRAGSELYVRDIAVELLRRGHSPICYSTTLGDVARDLRLSTVPVIERLSQLGAPPDVIHGQHHLETMAALARFPGVPAVYVCHGWFPFVEKPPHHPRIHHYVAVDETVRDRIVLENGIAERDVTTLLNFVDTRRFKPRRPLPPKPQRALIFSNQADDTNFVPPIRAACERAGLELDVIGIAAGQSVTQPELLLAGYDIVFAKARSAIEAIACGAAVILCDGIGAGPMVSSANFAELRRGNFGMRGLREEPVAEWFEAQIAAYDAGDAKAVSDRLRAEGDIRLVAERYEQLYENAIQRQRNAVDDAQAESRAIASYLEEWSAELKMDASRIAGRAEVLKADIEARAERDAFDDVDELETALRRLRELERSPFVRARTRLHRSRLLVSLYRALTRFRRY